MEVKSFTGHSELADLEKALGQYTLYYDVLTEREPDRVLYLAIRDETFNDLFEEPIGQLLLQKKRLRLIVFATEQEIILKWIP